MRCGMVSDHCASLGVNSVLQIFDAKIRFIFGLGITQVIGAFARGSGQSGTLVMIVVDGLFIVMLILCSRWAKMVLRAPSSAE